MPSDLRLTFLQADLFWEDPAANRLRFFERILALPDPGDLIILPEMFTTGFSMNAAALAEPTEGPTLEWMRTLAARTGAALTGSFIAREADQYFNRLVWMFPDGHYLTYDKRHLFSLAGEEKTYTAGRQRLLIEWKGWRILPLICYDLRFPVWSRNTDDYDLLIYVANFPERRRDAWNTLLRARAIENQAYTAGVNRCGNDGNGIYHAGDSCLIDFSGQIHYSIAHREGTFTTTLSYEEQRSFRQHFNFLADRDCFDIRVGERP